MKLEKTIGDEVGSFVDALLLQRNVPQQLPVPEFFLRNSVDYANQFIKQVFIRMDPAITEKKYVHIPEYNSLASYLINTKNKGLLLIGECGTGKSNILKNIIPMVYRMRDKIVFPVSCYDIHKIDVYETARRRRHLLLDEIGVETNINDYGEKFNPVERLINISEDENKALFATTNLSLQELAERYGKRAYDRISKRCAVIEFKTKSLR